MTIQELIKKIEQWAIDRELDKKGTVEGQLIKTAEEVSELIIAISKDDLEEIKDAVGDVFVTLVIGNLLTNIKVLSSEDTIAFENRIKYIGELHSLSIYSKYNIIKVILNDFNEIIAHGSYQTGIGNLWMDLNGVCLMYKLSPVDCIESAYNEIADRKGVVKNGSFVKASDLEKRKKESDLHE